MPALPVLTAAETIPLPVPPAIALHYTPETLNVHIFPIRPGRAFPFSP